MAANAFLNRRVIPPEFDRYLPSCLPQSLPVRRQPVRRPERSERRCIRCSSQLQSDVRRFPADPPCGPRAYFLFVNAPFAWRCFAARDEREAFSGEGTSGSNIEFECPSAQSGSDIVLGSTVSQQRHPASGFAGAGARRGGAVRLSRCPATGKPQPDAEAASERNAVLDCRRP